jgi:hypothetical protein
VDDGTITKLAPGLYAYPKETALGKVPAEDDKLLETFLKDRRFLLASPSAYNMLGVGTTQLYDKTVVYNHKRHGSFSLGGRTFDFRVKADFSKDTEPGISAGRSGEQSGSTCRKQDRSSAFGHNEIDARRRWVRQVYQRDLCCILHEKQTINRGTWVDGPCLRLTPGRM